MTLRLRITARAADEIERADTWWGDNRLAVPGALREDLKAAFKLLCPASTTFSGDDI